MEQVTAPSRSSVRSIREEEAIELMGEYLAAFLAVEQDWGVIDGLMHARKPEEALEHYNMALRSIHRILDERGGWIYNNLVRVFGEGVNLKELIDSASKVVSGFLESQSFKIFILKLVERALAKYPKYQEVRR